MQISAVIVIIFLNIIVFIATGTGVTTNVLLLSLCNCDASLYDLELWRLLTSAFIHFGLLHLGCNMLSLSSLGTPLEENLGPKKFVLYYCLTGIIASVVSCIYHHITAVPFDAPTLAIVTPWVGGGASGAIFGLAGILAMYYLRYGIKVKDIILFIAFPLVFPWILGADNAAHIGGLVSGLIIGVYEYRR